MAKKKKAEEHENLERWLVSYADFMTLLFATFVVLYALAQSDVNSFKSMEEALRKAFAQNIFDNQANIMEGKDSILDGENGATNPLMLEYMSQKYEDTSYEKVKQDIENLKEDGVSAEIDDRGLVIKFSDKAIKFVPGSAEIQKDSMKVLDNVANIIKARFSIHYIRVEGHTDSDIMYSQKYPSNWELSSARASTVVRRLISSYGFNYKLFSAVGLADTAPVVPNTSAANKAKNRRVEIIVLKNKYKDLSKKDMQKILKEVQQSRLKGITKKNNASSTDITGKDKQLFEGIINLSDQYENEAERLENINKSDYKFDGQKPDFMTETDERK